MLARLQTFIALTLAGLAVVWLGLTLPRGQGLAAVLGLLLLGAGHAVVLALECLLVARLNRLDPAPAASRGQWLRAWWAECLSAPRVFLWQQPFRSRLWPDHLPAEAGGRRGVLLVHGFVCNRGLWNRWLQRLTAQGVPFVAVDLEPVFGSIDDYRPRIDAAVARLQACTGLPPLVVAHSMGGLAVRAWRAQPGQAGRLAHLITLGTPHQGTWMARWGFVPNTVQMRIGGAWLLALQAAEARLGLTAIGITCFYSHCDNIVCPASTAMLAGADNRHLGGVAHVHMVDHPAPWTALQQQLGLTDSVDATSAAPPAAGPAG